MHPLEPRASSARTFEQALSCLLAEARIRHEALSQLQELADLNAASHRMEQRQSENPAFHLLTVGAARINILDPLHLIPEIDRVRPPGCYRHRVLPS